VTVVGCGNVPRITILDGVLPDQNALVGVLNTVHELRMPVLSVERQDDELSDPNG
jgi:hypothetical protein